MSAQAEAARNLIRARRPQDAIQVVLQALASAPDNYELHCVLAQAYLSAGHNNEALRAADQAVRLAPDDEWPHRLRSIALRRMGIKRGAVDAAMQCVRLAPQLAYARHTLAEAQLASKNLDEAYLAAIEGVRLSPEDADMYDLLGRCLLAKREPKAAEVNFRRALQLDPNDAAAHNNLGVALLRRGQRVEAVTEFNEAARIDPSFETARKNLYSGTRYLLGGGSVVFLLYLLIRASVVFNASHRSPWLFAVALAAFLLLVGVWIWRYRPFTRRKLPATAVAYYKAERKRLSVANRPVLLLRLASVPVLVGASALAVILNQPAVLLVGILLAFALLWLSPWAWRRLVRRPGQV